MASVAELLFESRLLAAGQRLQRPPSSKDELLGALEAVETYLILVKQRAPESTLLAARPSLYSLVNPELMRHQDKDVTLLVINCLCEIIRIATPEEPYGDDLMKEVLELIVGSFQELGDMNSPSFPRRLAILKTFANIKASAIMEDLEMDDLLLDMFKHFFSVVSQNPYSEPVYHYMEMIMCCVLNENDDIPKEELLSVLRVNLRREMKDLSPAAHSLSLKVVTSCAENLRSKLVPPIEPIICNCIHGYREIVYDIFRLASQEIDANQYTTAYQEVILLTESCGPEPTTSSEDNTNSQFAISSFYPEYQHNEMISDDRNNDIKKKTEADDTLVSSSGSRPPVREEPMSMAHSAVRGSKGISFPAYIAAFRTNNNVVVSKSLNRKKQRRIKSVSTDNKPQRDSARKKTVSAVLERTVEGSVDDINNDIKKKTEADHTLVSSSGSRPRVREEPTSMAHSEVRGSKGVSLPERIAAFRYHNDVAVSKLLNRKKQWRIKIFSTNNRPRRDSARKKSVSAVKRTVKGSVDDRNNDIKKKKREADHTLLSSNGKRPRVTEEPMSIAHSAVRGSKGFSLPEYAAFRCNNDVAVSKSQNRNRPRRDSARKKSLSAVEMTVEGSVEDAEKLVGRKVKGSVESYDGDREELQLSKQRCDFIDHISRLQDR